jgi:hypothetical protein
MAANAALSFHNASNQSLLLVDFTEAPWTNADGATTFAVGNVSITTNIGTLLGETDGIGINSTNDGGPSATPDEVNGTELMTVTLGTDQYLSGVWVSDFWASGAVTNDGTGQVVINNTTTITFTAADLFTSPSSTSDPTRDGFLFVAFGGNPLVDTLMFSVPGGTATAGTEFSVAGLEAAAVPLPPAAWLLASGLIPLLKRRRVA